MTKDIKDFVTESNAIEGIMRPPTDMELKASREFFELPTLTIDDFIDLNKVLQPDAELRLKDHQNVTVGNHMPPIGGAHISYALEKIITLANHVDKGNRHMAYELHAAFEALHPFTDGNGRTSRMLWLWIIGEVPGLSFLHSWYYESLNQWRKE